MLHYPHIMRTAILTVLGAVILWSTSFGAIKLGLADFPPVSFAALRFAFASAFMLILRFVGSRGARSGASRSRAAFAPDPVSRADLARLALGGLSGITIVFTLQTLAMRHTTSADANLLVAAYPVITILAELVRPNRRAGGSGGPGGHGNSGGPGGILRRLSGAAISIAGVYLVIDATGAADVATASGAGAAGNRLLGNLLIFVAGFAFALYNVLTKATVARYSAFTVVYWQTLFGAAGLALASLVEISVWRVPGPQAFGAAAYLGLFCSVSAYLLYSYGLSHLPAGGAANLINLQPAFGLALAALFLGETVSWMQVIGGAVIVAGVSLGTQPE